MTSKGATDGVAARTRWVLSAAAALMLTLSIALVPAASADPLEGEGCAVTPGGWGAPPAGENPGAELHEHFDELFGDELVVDGHTFETAQEVTDELPRGGDPLFNHAVALAINLAFGEAGLLNGTLENVTVDEGPYAGNTAQEMLALAEDALEDEDRTTSEYSDLIDALTGLNEERYGCNFGNGEEPVTPAAPPCPELTATARDAGNFLDWTEVENATTYYVYRSVGDGDLTQYDSVDAPATEYLDEDVEAGTTYSYVVTADNGEAESQDCEEVEVTAIPFFPSAMAAAAAVVATAGAFLVLRRRG